MAYTSDDLIALKNAINQIGFEDKDQKTLMDRFREVRDDESLNQLHEEWKKFKKKKSLHLHPDKGGNEDDFKQFGEKKEIIDGFFDKYTINEEGAGVQKRKFIDGEYKNNFFIIRDHVANTPSSSQSSSSSRDRYPTYWSQTGFEKQDGQYFGPRRASFEGARAGSFSSGNSRRDQNNFADLDDLLRKFFEKTSESYSSGSPYQNTSHSNQNGGKNWSQTNSSNFHNQTTSGQDSSKTNYQSNKVNTESSQNRSNQFEGGSESSRNTTFVFLFTTTLGVGTIFAFREDKEDQINREKESNDEGSSKFARRFSGVNNENGGRNSSRY